MVRFPPNTTMDNRTDDGASMPDYLETITDGVTGCRVTRISDGDLTPKTRHAYPKKQPWSKSGRKLVLNYNSPHYILDGNTYEVLSSNAQLPGNFCWANQTDDLGFGVISGNTLVSVDLSANDGTDRTTIHTFTGFEELELGAGEGNLSDDDRYVPLLGSDDAGSTYQLFVYDLVTDAQVSAGLTGQTHYDWIGMSPSGEFVVINWGQEGSGAAQGTKVYDREMNLLRHLNNGVEHGDVARDIAGNDIYVVLSGGQVAGAGLVSYRLDSGATTTLIANPPDYYGGHVSGRCIHKPGRVVVSSYGNDPDMPGIDEALSIATDGSGVIQSFAMCHHTQPAADEYQPGAVPNRDGSRVLFASDWEAGFTSPVYTFVAEYVREDAVGPQGAM